MSQTEDSPSKPPKLILALAYMCVTGATGFQNFFPTLTATLGYDKVISLLLVAPPYIFIMVVSWIHSWCSDKMRNRFWFFVYPIPITIVGFIVFMTTDEFGPKYFSFFLMNFAFVQNGTTYAWMSNSVPRPPAKRAVALAFMNSIGNSASIWTPYTYQKTFNNHYFEAMGVCIALQVIGACCGVGLKLYLEMQNRQLARMENEDTQLTDKDIKKLQKTAEFEGIDIAAARQLQKGFRYMV